tara:strand:+ start:915 stop:1085 length:171 start_codon:yes stop_codon:yes gene_type:complete
MSRVNIKECTLEELEDECIRVEGTNFGHNMIGIICSVCEERFGEDEADRLFDLYQA